MKRNIVANYMGQIYSLGIVIVITPFYIKYLGVNQYGLVGIFVMIQAVLNLIDAGLSPTLGREVAYARGQGKFRDVFRLVKSIESLFLFASIVILLFFYFFSNTLATEWLNKTGAISDSTITTCIFVMGMTISVRFFSTMYKSGLNGFEDQVWINKFNILVVSIKYFGVLLIIMYISSDIVYFFKFQLTVCIVELAFYIKRFYHKLGFDFSLKSILVFDFGIVKKVLPYALGVAYTTVINTVLMQADKLMLSKTLSLSEFAYLSVITIVSGGMFAVATPLFLAINPKIIALFSKNDFVSMKSMYGLMTQLVVWVVTSVSLVVCFYSKDIIFCFTGNMQSAEWGKNILVFYVLGNAMMILSSFQYYIQSAFGNVRLYVRCLTLAAIVYLPIMYFVVINYGALGSSILWLIFNLVFFFTITPYVHRKLLGKFHCSWLFVDILRLVLLIAITFYIIGLFFNVNIDYGKISVLFRLGVISALLLAITIFYIRPVQKIMLNIWRNR